MDILRIGAPYFLAVRPLLFGITRSPDERVNLIYDEPGNLALALEQGSLDAALIPSIEFLRGAGKYYIDGPAHVVKENSSSLILVTKEKIDRLQRVAVDEHSRTPVAVLRIVLDNLFGVLPDICVAKGAHENWREAFDGVLLTGDRGLCYVFRGPKEGVEVFNLSQLWFSVASRPLILSLWAFNKKRLEGELKKIFIASRNLGDQNLSLLSDGIAQTSEYDGLFLYEQFCTGWHYDMGPNEIEGLKTLEDYAFRYQLIREKRFPEELPVSKP